MKVGLHNQVLWCLPVLVALVMGSGLSTACTVDDVQATGRSGGGVGGVSGGALGEGGAAASGADTGSGGDAAFAGTTGVDHGGTNGMGGMSTSAGGADEVLGGGPTEPVTGRVVGGIVALASGATTSAGYRLSEQRVEGLATTCGSAAEGTLCVTGEILR